MASFVESLESRLFMSTAPSVAALKAEGGAVLADLVELGKVGKTNFKLIAADLKAAGELKTSASLVKTLSADALAKYAIISREVKGTGKQILVDVNKLLAAAAPLRKHPTSELFAARVTAAADKLQAAASADLAAIDAAITNDHDTNSANLTAIENANPGNTQLANDVANSIGPTALAAGNALAGDATIALTTDVTDVIDAFPA